MGLVEFELAPKREGLETTWAAATRGGWRLFANRRSKLLITSNPHVCLYLFLCQAEVDLQYLYLGEQVVACVGAIRRRTRGNCKCFQIKESKIPNVPIKSGAAVNQLRLCPDAFRQLHRASISPPMIPLAKRTRQQSRRLLFTWQEP